MAEAIFIKIACCFFDKYQIKKINRKNKGPSKMKIICNFASLILFNFFYHLGPFSPSYQFNHSKNSIYE